jgi:dTDP-4-dehydrorhamnose 3,5-epimerase
MNPAYSTDSIDLKDSTDFSREFIEGKIQDVVVYPLKKFYDDRGWLAELFRHDEITEEFYPAMAYISVTEPNVQRGPHEHVDQADLFCFIGPGNFQMGMWDNRANSPTYNYKMTMIVGEDNPQAVIVPKGVVHTYKNISGTQKGVVINCPNRLYMGEGKKEPIDEIRHEDDPETIFRLED